MRRAPQLDVIGGEPHKHSSGVFRPTCIPAIIARCPYRMLEFDVLDDLGLTHQADVTLASVVLVEQGHPAGALDLAHLSTSPVGDGVDCPVILKRQGLNNLCANAAVLAVSRRNAKRKFTNEFAREPQKAIGVHCHVLTSRDNGEKVPGCRHVRNGVGSWRSHTLMPASVLSRC